jgi:FecR protein
MYPKKPHCKLTSQAILLGFITAAYPMTGYCVVAGRADFIMGKVEAVATDGSRRILVKGSEINVGDAINTNAGARAQVRFIDGGFVSLQPNTQFRVDEFNYQNQTDGAEKSFFSLLKGGLRTITGAIGKVNRNTYKVTTANATIGIRGTGYNAVVGDDGLFVSVGEGAISLTNNVGMLEVTAGRAAFVADINTPPADTTEHPQLPPTGRDDNDRDDNDRDDNDRDDMGRVDTGRVDTDDTLMNDATNPFVNREAPSMISGRGYAMSYAYMHAPGGGTSIGNNHGLTDVTATFNEDSELSAYTSTSDSSSLVDDSNVTFADDNGIIGWGRWDGDTTSTAGPMGAGMRPGVLHYVIGLPTAVMPTAGMATYNLMGHTEPTATDSSTGWRLVTGSLNVFFVPGNTTANVAMNVANANTSYTVSGTAIGTGATFAGTGLSTTSAACSTQCSTSVNGFFAGVDASHAGLSYGITGASLELIQGAAAFSSTGVVPLPQ